MQIPPESSSVTSHTASGKYFTLIELLIVIAIIAILASMLLPALNKARQRGMATQCTSRLKQTMQGCLLYDGDYNGQIMLYEKVNNRSWLQIMQDRYLNRMVAICPNTKPYSGDDIKLETYRYCYGMGNYRYAAGREPYFGSSFYFNVADKGWGFNTKQTRQPSKLAVLADTVFPMQARNTAASAATSLSLPGLPKAALPVFSRPSEQRQYRVSGWTCQRPEPRPALSVADPCCLCCLRESGKINPTF